jgi:hypothetical protein
MEEVPVLRTSVLGDVNEIAVKSPVVLGGHTTAGYDSLKRLVETVRLKALLNTRILKVAASKISMRLFFMQSPHLQFRVYVDLQEEPEQR